MSNEKPIIESIVNGFSANISLVYLKQLGKVLEKIPKIAGPAALGGFGLKVGLNMDVNLTFDDLEDILGHGQFGDKAGLKFENVLEMAGVSKDDFDSYSTVIPEVSEEKLENREIHMTLLIAKLANAVDKAINASDAEDGSSEVRVDVVVENTAHLELSLNSSGVGAIGHLVFNALTSGQREEFKGLLEEMAGAE